MPGLHSPRSPSSAHRWRACPGSISECEGLPDTAGEEAIQGTVFHEHAAICTEFGIDPFGMIGARMLCEDGQHREFTKEMAMGMLPGLDLIRSISSAPGAKLYVEKQVDLSPWLGEDEFGTSDTFIVDVLQRRLTVFDWKWGAGVPVQPEWNDQAVLYALGVWHTFARKKFEAAGLSSEDVEVVIIIEQPRAPGGGGVWTVQMQTLLAEGVQIKADAAATLDPKAPRIPGAKQCQFCAAARLNTCRARAGHLMELLDLDIDDEDFEAKIEAEDVIDLPDRRALTPEARSHILLNRKMIEGWLEQLHDEAMDDAKMGRPVPGMKRVLGRSPARGWIDEDKATFVLVGEFGDDAYRKKLLSPAQVEEEVGKKVYREKFARHAVQGDPKPILVPESHPGKALRSVEDLLAEAWDETEETDEAAGLI